MFVLKKLLKLLNQLNNKFMTLKIQLDDKSSQTIHMSDKCLYRNEKSKKTPQEIQEMCQSIAYDIKHNYQSFSIS